MCVIMHNQGYGFPLIIMIEYVPAAAGDMLLVAAGDIPVVVVGGTLPLVVRGSPAGEEGIPVEEVGQSRKVVGLTSCTENR